MSTNGRSKSLLDEKRIAKPRAKKATAKKASAKKADGKKADSTRRVAKQTAGRR